MPRKRTRLEELLAALEIPECGCDPFTGCPCEEPCDCPRHLKPEACEHVAAAGGKLTLEEWRELFEGILGEPKSGKALDVLLWRRALEHAFGGLPHDHPDFHGEPRRAPRPMEFVSKEQRAVVRRRRHAQGYALRRPGDAETGFSDRIHRVPGRRDNNQRMEAGLVYMLSEEDKEGMLEPDEVLDEKLADYRFKPCSRVNATI